MQPPDRKKRILVALVGAAIALAFLGNFFWSFFKDSFPTFSGANHGSKAALFIFGGFLVVMALVVVFSVVRGIRRLTDTPAQPPPREEKPWLAHADWATGKIKSSSTVPSKFLIVWAVGALLVTSPIYWKFPEEWRNGNHTVLAVFLFPLVAVCLLAFVFASWRSRRRFGDCFFELAQIPAPLGGTLEGMIQTGAQLRLEHGLHLKLSCVRRTVSDSADNRNVLENILWQDEKVFQTEADLPEPEPGHSGIPVFFKLPANQPECYARGNESVFWRLDAKAKMSGPGFHAIFDVPVLRACLKNRFRVARATRLWRPATRRTDGKHRVEPMEVPFSQGDASPFRSAGRRPGRASRPRYPFFRHALKVSGAIAEADDESDPTADLQMPIEELRRDEHSKIQVNDGPNGREFYFPAARNPGTALFTTLFMLVFNGVAVVTFHLHAPILFPIVFGLIGVLLVFGTFNLWLKSSRVTIDSTGVRVTKCWLVFSRTRQFSASDAARFATKTGMQSGSQVFTDIKLITRRCDDDFAANKEKFQQTGQMPPLRFRINDPSGVTVASSIANVSEANWLVAEMNKTLGRK